MALSVISIEAVLLPRALGVNVTWIVHIPAGSSDGPQLLISEKSARFAPRSEMLPIVSGIVPVLESVMACTALLVCKFLTGEGQRCRRQAYFELGRVGVKTWYAGVRRKNRIIQALDCFGRVSDGSPVQSSCASVLLLELIGIIACRLRAPAPTLVKQSVPAFQLSAPNEDEFRPSSHCSIWSDDTIGTPRALRRCHDGIRSRRCHIVSVHVGRDHTVVSCGPSALSSRVSMSAGQVQVFSSGNCVVAW